METSAAMPPPAPRPGLIPVPSATAASDPAGAVAAGPSFDSALLINPPLFATGAYSELAKDLTAQLKERGWALLRIPDSIDAPLYTEFCLHIAFQERPSGPGVSPSPTGLLHGGGGGLPWRVLRYNGQPEQPLSLALAAFEVVARGILHAVRFAPPFLKLSRWSRALG